MAKKVLIVSLVRAGATILLAIGLIKILGGSYYGRVYSNLIINLILSFIIYFKFINQGEVKSKYLKYSLAFSIPLIPHYLSHILLGQVDRVLIARYFTNYEVGMYSFSYNLGMMGFFIWVASNSAWLPRFYKEFENKFDGTLTKIDNYIIVFTGIITIILFVSPEVVRIMGRKSEYGSTISLVAVIIISYYIHFLYTFFSKYSNGS